MALRHNPQTGATRTLATEVERAESFLEQARGLMFRRRFPEGSALVFPFDDDKRRTIHMLGVLFAIDVLWLVDNEVTKKRRLRPLIGLSWGRADTIIELPAGTCDDVEPGDQVFLEGS